MRESSSTVVGSLVEIDLESSRDRDNPYLDVKVTAEFSGPGGELIRRDGFWDGGRTWRVRFMSTVAGRWTYRIQSDDPSDHGLNRGPGELTSESSDTTRYSRLRGFLRVSDDGHPLAHADGTPFFWLADTHWRFAWERWDEANKRGWSSQFRGTVDRRVEQGFSVYQTNLMGFGRGWDTGTCWADGEPYRRL